MRRRPRPLTSSATSFRRPVFRDSRYGGKPRHQGRYIDPSRFINRANRPSEREIFIPKHTFNDFSFVSQLNENIRSKGYTKPTRIQDGAITPVLDGRDVLGLADTGTGKTAAFLLPIINRLKTGQSSRALIIAPTRELAVQINDEFKDFAKNLGLYSAICIGGANIKVQKSQLARQAKVVIGTSGRLKDLSKQGSLRFNAFDVVVLDEVDRMLDMGFRKEIELILSQLAPIRQTLCFSATIPGDISQLLNGKLNDPAIVKAEASQKSEHIEQNILRAQGKDEKMKVLLELLEKPEFDKVIIFTQTKWGANQLADNLRKQGLRADAIHGNKSQPQRQRTLLAFKTSKVSILVATDVAARGLDIPKVSHVINFDKPTTYEDYVHRIGRTGRAGQVGQALTFVS